MLKQISSLLLIVCIIFSASAARADGTPYVFTDGDKIAQVEADSFPTAAAEGYVFVKRYDAAKKRDRYFQISEEDFELVQAGKAEVTPSGQLIKNSGSDGYGASSKISDYSSVVTIEDRSGGTSSNSSGTKSTGGSLPDLKVTVSTTGSVPIKHTTTTHVRPYSDTVAIETTVPATNSFDADLASTVKTSNYDVSPGGLDPGDYSVDLPNPTSSKNSEYAGANITDFDINVPTGGYGKSFGAAPKTEPVPPAKSTTAQKSESEQIDDNFEMDLSGFNFDEYETIDDNEPYEYERIKIEQPSEEQEVSQETYVDNGFRFYDVEKNAVENPSVNPLVYNPVPNPESAAKNNIIQQPGLGDLIKDSIDNAAEKQKIEAKDSATSQSVSRINSIAAGINAELGGADDASVWRNADGKFNTTRLLADLGGAAVGGVTAGLITSSVMKNNQVKKELKDVKCRIANKDVATWGDSFQVSTSAVKVFKIGG